MTTEKYVSRSYYELVFDDGGDGTLTVSVMPDDPHSAAQAIGATLREFGKGLVFVGESAPSPGQVYNLRFRIPNEATA